MAVKKLLEKLKGIKEVAIFLFDQIERKYESGELSDSDVSLIPDSNEFKLKHPVIYKAIYTAKKIFKFAIRLYRFFKEHKYIPAIS